MNKSNQIRRNAITAIYIAVIGVIVVAAVLLMQIAYIRFNKNRIVTGFYDNTEGTIKFYGEERNGRIYSISFTGSEMSEIRFLISGSNDLIGSEAIGEKISAISLPVQVDSESISLGYGEIYLKKRTGAQSGEIKLTYLFNTSKIFSQPKEICVYYHGKPITLPLRIDEAGMLFPGKSFSISYQESKR